MPLQNPQDVAAHSALDTGVHGVGAEIVANESQIMDAFAATLPEFKVTPATGTTSYPERVNDNSTASDASGNVIGEYSEVDFGRVVSIDQWRIFGHADNNQDGHHKIEYYGTDLALHDWVTGIATNLAAWTGLSAETAVYCSKIRLTVTAVDTGVRGSKCSELEVYHS